jgi:hypothetical protein
MPPPLPQASRGYTSTTYPAIADVHAPLVARAATPAITRGYSKAACAAVDAGNVAALAAMLRSGELDPNAQGRGAHTVRARWGVGCPDRTDGVCSGGTYAPMARGA